MKIQSGGVISGFIWRFGKAIKKIQKQMENATQDVNGEVAFSVLFNDGFMQRYTDYNNLDDFLNENGLNFETQEEFDAFPDEEMDKIVQAKTRFQSWVQMQEKAGADYVKAKLKSKGFDIR